MICTVERRRDHPAVEYQQQHFYSLAFALLSFGCRLRFGGFALCGGVLQRAGVAELDARVVSDRLRYLGTTYYI